LTAKRDPKEKKYHHDRGVHLYKQAMATSKLIAINRSDKDPQDIEVEKNGQECSFHPRTNHNTDYLRVRREEKANGIS
jgi:hypothetical protein